MFSDYPYYYSISKASDGSVIERPGGLRKTMTLIKHRLLKQGRYVISGSKRRAIALHSALAAHRDGTELRQGDIVYAAS
jgi:hypothetical protein